MNQTQNSRPRDLIRTLHNSEYPCWRSNVTDADSRFSRFPAKPSPHRPKVVFNSQVQLLLDIWSRLLVSTPISATIVVQSTGPIQNTPAEAICTPAEAKHPSRGNFYPISFPIQSTPAETKAKQSSQARRNVKKTCNENKAGLI